MNSAFRPHVIKAHTRPNQDNPPKVMAIPKQQFYKQQQQLTLKRQAAAPPVAKFDNNQILPAPPPLNNHQPQSNNLPYGPSRLPTLGEISYLQPLKQSNSNTKQNHKKVKFPPADELLPEVDTFGHENRQQKRQQAELPVRKKKPFTVFNTSGNNNKNTNNSEQKLNNNWRDSRVNQQQFSIAVFNKQGGGYQIQNKNKLSNISPSLSSNNHKNVRFVNNAEGSTSDIRLQQPFFPLQPRRAATSRKRADFN